MFEALFQTFEDPETGVALTARLAALREELARRKLTGFVIPRADQQQNEYVAASEERLAWLTGFTGSAGMAVVLTHEAAVFVDGRYTLQAGKQVDAKAWQVEPLVDPSPESWLANHLVAGDRLGFDPWLHTSAAAERLSAACAKAGAELIAVDTNPLDSVWTERPAPPLGPVAVHGPQISGEAETDKLGRIRCCRIRTRWHGLSISAAPTSRTRRCRCPMRWCRRTAGPRCSSITASSPTAPATISNKPPMSRNRRR
jgi:Xaa-Pro aminopeptidase